MFAKIIILSLIPTSVFADNTYIIVNSIPLWSLFATSVLTLGIGLYLKNKSEKNLFHKKVNSILNKFNSIVILIDEHQNITEANRAASEFFKKNIEELTDKSLSSLNINITHELTSNINSFTKETSDGKIIYVTVTKERNINGTLIEIKDITLAINEKTIAYQISNIFETSSEGVMDIDKNGIITDVNQSFTTITGFSKEEVVGKQANILHAPQQNEQFYKDFWEIIQNNGFWKGEIVNKRKNGEKFTEFLHITGIKDYNNKIQNYIGVFTDLTSIRNNEKTLYELAYLDTLTGLPNRLSIKNIINETINIIKNTSNTLACIFIDIERFKDVNDSLGHLAGDDLLVMITQRIKNLLPTNATLGRLGGDEFIVLLHNTNTEEIVNICECIIKENQLPYSILEKHNVYVGSALGISTFPNDAIDTTELLRNADSAMHKSKRGQNSYSFYTKELTKDAQNILIMEENIRKALAHKEFSMNYQPQIDTTNNTIVGVEALLRWEHPTLGMISPLDFIPIAEKTGLIYPIGTYVLQEAIEEIKKINKDNKKNCTMSINISPKQFNNPAFYDDFKEILISSNVNPKHLCLELTENTLMTNGQKSLDILNLLKNTGVHLSIDDFGTGYSSLSYLKYFPINELKIDRSFVKDIPQDHNDMAIATTIINMGNALNLSIVAEGVETIEQRDFLLAAGCHIHQGYFYSKPLTPEVLEEFLKD